MSPHPRINKDLLYRIYTKNRDTILRSTDIDTSYVIAYMLKKQSRDNVVFVERLDLPFERKADPMRIVCLGYTMEIFL